MAVGAAVSVAPAHADPVCDQKFIDYFNKNGGSTWKAGYNLMKEGWTQSEAETFIQAAVPTYCPGLWG